MKLYRKRLHSLEELKRERQVLKYKKKHTGSEDWFNLKDLTGGKSGKEDDHPGILNASMMSTILSALGSKSVVGTALSLAPTLVNLVSKRSGKKNVIEKMAMDVVGGYVKWKLVQMGYRGIKLFAKARKNKRSKEAAEA